MEVDGQEEEEISSELKQTQIVCYMTVLGQAWPDNITTQGKEISSELKQTQIVCYMTVLGQAWPDNITTQG